MKKTAKKKKTTRKKHPGGRPTKYRKEFCKMLIDFFDVDIYEKIELPHFQRDGETIAWMDYKLVPARMPSLSKFAKKIGVHISNVYEWLNEKSTAFQPQFREAFTRAKEIRKDWLIDLGLSGLTPPLSFKFVAVNVTDMRDKQETEHSGVIGTREMSNEEIKEYLKDKRIPCDDAIAS